MCDPRAVRLSQISETEIDRPALFALYRITLYQYIAEAFGWNEELQKNRFDTCYDNQDFMSVTLESSDVGYISVKENPDNLHLSLLIIRPEHQNQGIGQIVMRKLMSHAAESQQALTLSSFSNNEGAIRFYRRLGFSLVTKDEHFVNYRFPAD